MSAALARKDEWAAPAAASESIRFFAAGVAKPKGSTRAFVLPGKNGGKPRAILTNMAGQPAKTWAAIVSGAALDAMAGRAPLVGAVAVHLVFHLQRPKAHSTKKGLRDDRPTFVAKMPDLDKLARNSLDALTGICFGDDAQIARLFLEKRYADVTTGATFTVERIGG